MFVEFGIKEIFGQRKFTHKIKEQKQAGQYMQARTLQDNLASRSKGNQSGMRIP
jgi:hypothetical protein